MKRTAIFVFTVASVFAIAGASNVFAGGEKRFECRFSETRGPGSGGGGAVVHGCRAVLIEKDRTVASGDGVSDELRNQDAILRVRCSTGFRINDENAHQFGRNGDDFTVAVDHDRMAVLMIHDNHRNGNSWQRATLLTSSDPIAGYLSNNDRFKGVCREVDGRTETAEE